MGIFNENTANIEDKAASILSEIMNDNAPLGWERYRGIVHFIAKNDKLMLHLNSLSSEIKRESRSRLRRLRGK